MTQDEIIKLKEKNSMISDKEEIERDIYLRNLAIGKIQGPPVGYPDIDKPWLKFYPENAITSEIPKIRAYDYVYESNKENLNQIAFSYFGNKITYKEFFIRVQETAAAFKSIGVNENDIVTKAMATTPEMVYTLYALNRIGATANIIDPRLTTKEIIDKVNLSNSKLLVGIEMAVENTCKNKEQTTLENIILVSPLESAPLPIKLLGRIKEKKFNDENVLTWKEVIFSGKTYGGTIDAKFEKNHPAVILYTGGTTGEPKGVVLTNENMNTMALTQVVSGFNINREDTFLNFLPPFSAYSIVNAVHDPLVLGFNTTLIPMFKPEDFPKLMKKYRPNHVLSGPILWDIMMSDKLTQNIDLSFLKSPISGGDSLKIEKEKEINKYLKERGCQYKLQQGYGMTEVSAAACYSTEDSYTLGSVGIPYVKNNILIRDLSTNDELKYGEEGEIFISTPTMMKGYFKNESSTSEIIKIGKDGKRWISTGDIGYVDKNGNLFIVGRVKRMIVRSGNKIFPSNIENLIMKVDGIKQCSIVEMPDLQEKSAPIAHLVVDEKMIDEKERLIDEIERLITEKMPAFNIPKKYVFRDSIPITEMSKLELESVNYVSEEEKIVSIINYEQKVLKK